MSETVVSVTPNNKAHSIIATYIVHSFISWHFAVNELSTAATSMTAANENLACVRKWKRRVANTVKLVLPDFGLLMLRSSKPF